MQGMQPLLTSGLEHKADQGQGDNLPDGERTGLDMWQVQVAVISNVSETVPRRPETVFMQHLTENDCKT
jgi:hypothetical protein